MNEHFRKSYPHGYPDDKEFVRLDHYQTTVRKSSSGYKNVGTAEAGRREKWRVKIDSKAVGHYEKKVEVCEVVYWYIPVHFPVHWYVWRRFPPSSYSTMAGREHVIK